MDRGELKIYHQPTEDMIGDFFTKPLQGSKFLKFRSLILGLKKAPTGGTKDSVVEGGAGEHREAPSKMAKTDIPRRNSVKKAPLQVSFKK